VSIQRQRDGELIAQARRDVVKRSSAIGRVKNVFRWCRVRSCRMFSVHERGEQQRLRRLHLGVEHLRVLLEDSHRSHHRVRT
jgi:hypothetical protein